MVEVRRRGESAEPSVDDVARPSLVGADRVLAVLTELARHPGGAGLDELARSLGAPKPTVHRALASLRRAGLAELSGRGHYRLGDEFIRLAFTNHEGRPDHVRVQPVLTELAERYDETTHYAVLDGRSVIYRSKVDPPTGAIRLTSTVGGRNPAHCTAVGKLLLSYQLTDDDAVAAWVRAGPLPARTPATRTTTAALAADLDLIRRRGFSTDDEENEPGIVCLAVPLHLGSPSVPSGAVSVSAPAYRTSLDALIDAAPRIREIVARPFSRKT